MDRAEILHSLGIGVTFAQLFIKNDRACQIRKGVNVIQNGTSPLTPFTYFVFGVISLPGVIK